MNLQPPKRTSQRQPVKKMRSSSEEEPDISDDEETTKSRKKKRPPAKKKKETRRQRNVRPCDYVPVVSALLLFLAFTLRGFAKKKNSKNPRLLWKWVVGPGLTRNFLCVGKSSKNSPKPVLIFLSSIPCVYMLLKCVGYYDLSVLSMSVIGLQKKKFGWRVGGWGELSNFFWMFGNFLTLQSP